MANEKRLIDANAMREYWLENGENECVYDTNAVLDSIDAQPTVDATDVVRCKVCFYGYRDLVCTNPRCAKSFYGCPVPPEHYCSFGERIPDD